MRKLSLLLVALALTACTVAPVKAELSPAEVLYMLAAKLAKLPISDEPPQMSFVSNIAELQKVCKRTQPALKACQIGEHIYLDGSVQWRDQVNQSVLVHEFVHHLQYLSYGPAKTCAENVDREIVAYQIQNQFLYETGHEVIQPPSFVHACDKQPEK